MRFLLTTIGTDGDTYPYVGLGDRLRDRGHSVLLVAGAHYGELARARRFDFHPLVSEGEHEALFGHPDFWNPWKNAPILARWGMRHAPRQYRELCKLATPGTVMIASPGVFAASLLHEKAGFPLVNLVLQPWMIPSSIAPPVMPGFLWLRNAPRPVWRAFWVALDLVAYSLGGAKLNRLRRSIGLGPRRRILRDWLSPHLALGMFPEWYGQPRADWPSQLKLAGFPMADGGVGEALDPALLDFCQAGAPPFAFTFGTGMAHPGKLFRAALAACAKLGLRGVFLTKHPGQLPWPLPPTIQHRPFAPFQSLFPLCAGVVHHGGIGTVARAMAMGIPQIVWPLCFDQIDNGVRVRSIGVGDWLKPGPDDGTRLAAAIAGMLGPDVKSRCLEVASRFQNVDGLGVAADLVLAHALASRRPA